MWYGFTLPKWTLRSGIMWSPSLKPSPYPNEPKPKVKHEVQVLALLLMFPSLGFFQRRNVRWWTVDIVFVRFSDVPQKIAWETQAREFNFWQCYFELKYLYIIQSFKMISEVVELDTMQWEKWIECLIVLYIYCVTLW